MLQTVLLRVMKDKKYIVLVSGSLFFDEQKNLVMWELGPILLVATFFPCGCRRIAYSWPKLRSLFARFSFQLVIFPGVFRIPEGEVRLKLLLVLLSTMLANKQHSKEKKIHQKWWSLLINFTEAGRLRLSKHTSAFPLAERWWLTIITLADWSGHFTQALTSLQHGTSCHAV